MFINPYDYKECEDETFYEDELLSNDQYWADYCDYKYELEREERYGD